MTRRQRAAFALQPENTGEPVEPRINAHLSPSIRVSISQFGNPERYQRIQEERLKGARLKHLVVAQKLANVFWPGDLVEALRDREIVQLLSAGATARYAEGVTARRAG